VEARDTIVRKPIRIRRVVDSYLIVGAGEGIKEGGTLSTSNAILLPNREFLLL